MYQVVSEYVASQLLGQVRFIVPNISIITIVNRAFGNMNGGKYISI